MVDQRIDARIGRLYRGCWTQYNDEYETAGIRLNFCFDNSIDLEIEGLLSENPIIYLARGEVERIKKILWKID